jgi:hypothetical protein
MRLTVPHFHDFGEDRPLVGDDLLNPDAWDRLRTKSDGIFALPGDREEWDRRVAADTYQERRARAVVAWLDRLEVEHLASYGVGAAPVERWIQRLRPNLRLSVTDFGGLTVERLRQHFEGVAVHHHDFLRDEPLEADLHLFCCVDTDLSDDQWRLVFRNFSGARMLFYPCITFGVRAMIGELRHRRPGRNAIHCGYWRTKGRFDELVSTTHDPERLRDRRAGTAWLCHPRR